jgi:hypothetical protein
VPRLAGQREDYLAKALRAYQSGDRPGYEPAMAEVMAAIPASQLPTWLISWRTSTACRLSDHALGVARAEE